MAAVLHAVRRGGVSASRTVARHYWDEAELGLERSIQRDFCSIGSRHLIGAADGTRGTYGRRRRIAGSLVKSKALLALRRDARSRCFQGCAYLIAGRPNEVVRTLHSAASSTQDQDLASAIDITLASAYREIGSLNDWLESHVRCATRSNSSLRVVGRVFATFAALRTANRDKAVRLLHASYEASPDELRAVRSELTGFMLVACKENPVIARDLIESLRKIDIPGMWVSLLEDATK